MTFRSLGVLVAAIAIAQPLAPKVTIHLAGDSTMAPKLETRRPETGWGEKLDAFLDTTSVRVLNHARNGRSTRTFISEGRWQALLDSANAGDFVFIQFGHNDAATNRPDRQTSPADYRTNLIRFTTEAKAKGLYPVLMTPVMRRRFDDKGEFYDSHREYPGIVRDVAREQSVPLIDMHQKSGELLRLMGQQASTSMFLQLSAGEHPNYPNGVVDNTHFSPLGAELMAALAVDGITESLPELAARLRKILVRQQSPTAP